MNLKKYFGQISTDSYLFRGTHKFQLTYSCVSLILFSHFNQTERESLYSMSRFCQGLLDIADSSLWFSSHAWLGVEQQTQFQNDAINILCRNTTNNIVAAAATL